MLFLKEADQASALFDFE